MLIPVSPTDCENPEPVHASERVWGESHGVVHQEHSGKTRCLVWWGLMGSGGFPVGWTDMAPLWHTADSQTEEIRTRSLGLFKTLTRIRPKCLFYLDQRGTKVTLVTSWCFLTPDKISLEPHYFFFCCGFLLHHRVIITQDVYWKECDNIWFGVCVCLCVT